MLLMSSATKEIGPWRVSKMTPWLHGIATYEHFFSLFEAVLGYERRGHNVKKLAIVSLVRFPVCCVPKSLLPTAHTSYSRF